MANDIETVRLLKGSADQGNADAQYHLGMAYKEGAHGLPSNYGESQRYIRLAARQGHEGARSMLAIDAPRLQVAKWLYMRGWGYK